ncbi:T9SS C-terminal target domain-containing protein [Bacteroidetes/Chlorobi group bacterium Naka2016]|jgi:hypothetical protein|nr:MAG: T9SS C-terminal target domain-containing protein [Bacteroidetes/Chlorobi group bacterium Naka2016]
MRAKNFSLLALFFFITFQLSSQYKIEWAKCFGGKDLDEPTHLAKSYDGGYFIVGLTASGDGDVKGKKVPGKYNDYDAWILHIDSTGNIVSQKCLGGSDWDGANCIVQTKDSCYLIGAWSSSTDYDVSKPQQVQDLWFIKLDRGGNIIWKKTYGGRGYEQPKSILVLEDGNFLITGYSSSIQGEFVNKYGSFDLFVIKLDASGEIKKIKFYGGTHNDKGNFIMQTSDGGFLVVGSTSSNDGDVVGWHPGYTDTGYPLEDFWVLKLDQDLNLQWQKPLGGSNPDVAHSAVETPDNGFIVVGETSSNNGDVQGLKGNQNIWLVKLSSSGEIEWSRCYGGSFVDFATNIVKDFDGNYLVLGHSASNDNDVISNNGGMDVWLFKINLNGEVLWSDCFGGSSTDMSSSLLQLDNGNVLLACSSSSKDGDVSGWHQGYNPDAGYPNPDFWIVNLKPSVFGVENSFQSNYSTNLEIYPNPSNSFCTFILKYSGQIVLNDFDYEIIDPFGQSLLKSNNFELETHQIKFFWHPENTVQSGVYFVKVNLGGKVLVKPFVHIH